jgi:serine protease Do/serine protease DegQ
LNGRAISSANDLTARLALLRVGEQVEVDIVRAGETRRLFARIADPFEGYVDAASFSEQLSGTRLREIVDESHLGTNTGVAVGPVTEGSPAWRSGLREGDVIFQVNRERVTTLAQLEDAAGQRISQLRLRRGQRLVTLVSR